MLGISCVLTENCNLSCSHCYMSAGPGKEDTTVTRKDFEKMLSHLPAEKLDLGLSGGEIFTVEERLREYLELIEIENQKRRGDQKIRIIIQSNGFWLKKKNVRTMLSYLKEKNVNALNIASNDKYHQEQGLKLNEDLISLAKEYFSQVLITGASDQLMPIGRANNQPARLIIFGQCSSKNYKDYRTLTIKNNGRVYPCCFQFFPYPGNIFEESLSSILQRVEKNPRLSALDNEGIEGIAKYDKFNAERISTLIRLLGDCGTCGQLYGRNLKLC